MADTDESVESAGRISGCATRNRNSGHISGNFGESTSGIAMEIGVVPPKYQMQEDVLACFDVAGIDEWSVGKIVNGPLLNGNFVILFEGDEELYEMAESEIRKYVSCAGMKVEPTVAILRRRERPKRYRNALLSSTVTARKISVRVREARLAAAASKRASWLKAKLDKLKKERPDFFTEVVLGLTKERQYTVISNLLSEENNKAEEDKKRSAKEDKKRSAKAEEDKKRSAKAEEANKRKVEQKYRKRGRSPTNSGGREANDMLHPSTGGKEKSTCLMIGLWSLVFGV